MKAKSCRLQHITSEVIFIAMILPFFYNGMSSVKK